MNYTNYTNLDSRFMRTYEPGDRLVKGWTGELTDSLLRDITVSHSPLLAAERIYMLHNRDDRPDGRMCPSMSVGDVVVIGEVAMSVAPMGFKIVQLDPDDIQPYSYLEAMR